MYICTDFLDSCYFTCQLKDNIQYYFQTFHALTFVYDFFYQNVPIVSMPPVITVVLATDVRPRPFCCNIY